MSTKQAETKCICAGQIGVTNRCSVHPNILIAKIAKWTGFQSTAVQIQVDYEKQINEICVITDNAPEKVKEFYENHSYSLEYIKDAVLAGAQLNEDSMKEALFERLVPSVKSVDLDNLYFRTWKDYLKDYLSDIPYYTGYYLAYPFIWLVFWLWEGIVQAKEEIWD